MRRNMKKLIIILAFIPTLLSAQLRTKRTADTLKAKQLVDIKTTGNIAAALRMSVAGGVTRKWNLGVNDGSGFFFVSDLTAALNRFRINTDGRILIGGGSTDISGSNLFLLGSQNGLVVADTT